MRVSKLFGIVAGLFLACAPTYVVMVIVDFEGVIRNDLPCCAEPIPAPLSGVFSHGDPFFGRYVYDFAPV